MQPEAEERWAIIKSMALEYYELRKNRVEFWEYPGDFERWLSEHETIKKYPHAFLSCKFYILNFLMYVVENGITDNPDATYDAFKEDLQKEIAEPKKFIIEKVSEPIIVLGNPAAYEDVPRIQGITTS
jgi:hypothetical protein